MKFDKTKRYRNWLYILYPESLPKNFKEYLYDLGVEGYLSPLHKDDLDGDGKLKKEHYHLVLTFGGQQTYEFAKSIADDLNAPSPEPPYRTDKRGALRYLCHLDSPHKAQYSVNDVICFGGGDYLKHIEGDNDKYRVIGEMMEFLISNYQMHFCDFLIYCKNENMEWFKCLCDSSTYVIREFIKSAHGKD